MINEIVARLFASFDDLQESINTAKEVLMRRGVNDPKIMTRIESYEEMTKTQRNLGLSLVDHMNKNNVDEILRHVKLINGISEMIRDDAREFLSNTRGENDKTN